MCALASLAARACAQVGALEAGAPALAAAATCPLRAADLMRPTAMALLAPVIHIDFMEAVISDGGLTLHEARLVYRSAPLSILASIVRRILWRDVLAWLEQDAEDKRLAWVTFIVQALCTIIKCPFFVRAAADRRTAIREAAERHAPPSADCARAKAAAPALTASAPLKRRYTVCDVYGLAASVATSWAVLAASSPDSSTACALLAICTPILEQVRRRRAAGSPCAGCRPSGRATQAVFMWCGADASEALGGAALAPSSVLAHYHSGLCAVLVWLAGAPALPRALDSVFMPEAADLADRTAERLLPGARAPACLQPPLLSVRQTAAWPAAAPGRRAAAVSHGARHGAARHVPEGLLQRARGRSAGQRPGAGAVRGLRCAPNAWRRQHAAC